MRIRKPLSLSLSLFLVGVYTVLIHARPFQTVPDHPSPNALPFRIGARVSLAIQIHFLHDITGEIYSGWVITVWRDCLHFAATSLKNELGGCASRSLFGGCRSRVHCTGKVFTDVLVDETDRWTDSNERQNVKGAVKVAGQVIRLGLMWRSKVTR